MIISFDTYPLADNQKTGIGHFEEAIVKAILRRPDAATHSFYLDYFAFRDKSEAHARFAPYLKAGAIARVCRWIPAKAYRLLCNFIPLPYSLLFGKKARLTHFFNFHIPPGVSGKRVTTIYDMVYKAFPETMRLRTKIMFDLALKISLKRADNIITISEFSKAEITRYTGTPPEKITVVPCGVDRELFHPCADPAVIIAAKAKYKLPERYFLYLGTLEPRKNIERLIEAYAALKANRGESTPALVLAGRPGWLYESIFARVKRLKLENDVIFTGYVEREDTPPLMCGALAFLFPSLYEGFGMPPLEAMACGVPVLTSNRSSLPEVTGDAAVLVDPYRAGDIQAGMARLLDDAELRARLSAAGLRRAEMFSWERAAEIVMGVYEIVVTRK